MTIPSQASLVRMVKLDPQNPVTLAIGDGANDVGMIHEAKVGVGISGKEGKHAANSADFAIGNGMKRSPLLLLLGSVCFFPLAPHPTLSLSHTCTRQSTTQPTHFLTLIAPSFLSSHCPNSGQFRFLVPLLLEHGRFNYIRCSKLVLYSFFKNLVLVSTLFYYCIYSGFSGTCIEIT